jgi:hypothetical protein
MLPDEKEGGVVDIAGYMPIAWIKRWNFGGDAEDAVIFCRDT